MRKNSANWQMKFQCLCVMRSRETVSYTHLVMILRHVAKIESLFDFEPEINEEFNLMSESYLSTDLSVVNIIQNFLGMCKTSDNS